MMIKKFIFSPQHRLLKALVLIPVLTVAYFIIIWASAILFHVLTFVALVGIVAALGYYGFRTVKNKFKGFK